jgi:hypothetical protein
MTRRDLRADVALDLARSLEEPTPADRARVYAALRQRIAAGPAAHEGRRPVGPSHGLGLGARAAGSRLSRYVLVGVLAGGVGYWLGRSGSREARDDATLAIASTTANDAVQTEARGDGTSAPSVAALGPGAGVASSRSASPEQHDAGAPSSNANGQRRAGLRLPREKAPDARGERANEGKALARPTSERAATSAPAGEDRTFFEALRLLQRAERSVQNERAELALTLLDELDERFPPALLNEERNAIRVLALCALGDASGARRVASRLGTQSDSIYSRRLERSCVARRSEPEEPAR